MRVLIGRFGVRLAVIVPAALVLGLVAWAAQAGQVGEGSRHVQAQVIKVKAPMQDSFANDLHRAATATYASGNLLTTVAACTPDRYRGPNCTKFVLPTYDDCPDRDTLTSFRNKLSWLRSHGFAIVIAPTGACINKFKRLWGVDITVLARSYGQWVINHSVTHPHFYQKSNTVIAQELGAPGVVTNFGRPPYGEYNSRIGSVYTSKGMRAWLWNVDTRDWEGKTCTQIVSHIRTYTKAGQSILMHMQWHGFTTTCMGQIFVALYKQRGLLVCRVYRGSDNVGSPLATPRLLPSQLPCGR